MMQLTALRYRDLYKLVLTVLALNVPVITFILMLNIRIVDCDLFTCSYILSVCLGYYLIPVLAVVNLLFLILFALRRLTIILTGFVVSGFVFYLLIDHFAYSVTRIHIDFFWLEWLVNDYSGLGLPSSTLFIAFLALLVVLAVEYGIWRLARRLKVSASFVVAVWLVPLLAYGFSQVTHIVAYQRNDSRITGLTTYFPAYMPFVSHKYALKYGGIIPTDVVTGEKTSASRLRSFHYPIKAMRYDQPAEARPPNILLIFLESWRYDAMTSEITPNIYALSRKSSVFFDHFSSGNSTIAGVFGLFYGLHPTYWTAVKANSIHIDNPVLIDALKANGYDFGVFAKSNFERHKLKAAIFRGITVHESFAGKTVIEQDRNMTKQLQSFLRQHDTSSPPFFAFAFYKSNHFPYSYPAADTVFHPAAELNLMFTGDHTDPARYLNDYRNSTRFVDSLVGSVLQLLDSLGQADNTVIAITTDHGEEFNDNQSNYWGHGSNYTQYQTRVPLVLYLPGKAPRHITAPTSHIDIPPTLLRECLGCTNDVGDYSNGLDLFGPLPERRPFVISSYINHAFIIDNNVYEVFPLYLKEYKLADIRQKADRPPVDLVKKTMEGINRFYDHFGPPDD